MPANAQRGSGKDRHWHGTEGARADVVPRRIYPFRVFGIGLGALPVLWVLHEVQAPWPAWAWTLFTCFAWPHLALWWALRSADPLKAELRNLMIDSVIAGSLVPLMQFNLLPSAVLLSVVTSDKINSGIRGLWQRSLPGMLLALLATAAFTGFALRPQTSMEVIVATLPLLVIHTLAVSTASYRLVRRVQKQNRQLAALNRRDALTGLQSRGYWERQAQRVLDQQQRSGAPAMLVLLDIDQFKQINDRHGHGTGDDVLHAIADLLARAIPADAHAGRLGGDEFVVVLPVAPAEARQLAERLRAGVEALDFRAAPGLRASVSIGLAEAADGNRLDLREWIEAADRAMYRAKQGGRNRVAESAPR